MNSKKNFVELILQRLFTEQTSIVAQWNNPVGTATRHFIVDDFLPKHVCREIFDAFPRDGSGFFNRESFREKKRTSANLDAYDPVLSDITYAFQDQSVIEAIAKFINFEQIEPDPLLYAGGLSMMFNGDFLNPHLDNSHDGNRTRYRRLNLLYYVTPGWQTDNGGNLELWNEDRTTPKTITAVTNRLIVMETNRSSWHSVSTVTVDTPRCCVSNYYFSQKSPHGDEYFHVTSFTGRPGQKIKNIVGFIDNIARNFVSRTFKIGRGQHLINQPKDTHQR
jgi:Rps23 Pro-64 3,4-dihydroxylase Tpa1-like proline 4-hydroxylase